MSYPTSFFLQLGVISYTQQPTVTLINQEDIHSGCMRRCFTSRRRRAGDRYGTHNCAKLREGLLSVFRAVQHSLGLRDLGSLRALHGTFLFEGLTRLLGHGLPGRFIRHRGPFSMGAWVVPVQRAYTPSARPARICGPAQPFEGVVARREIRAAERDGRSGVEVRSDTVRWLIRVWRCSHAP